MNPFIKNILDPLPILFIMLLISSIAILSKKKYRKKVSWKFVLAFTIIYFNILFLDVGSSTPYAIMCKNTVTEQNPWLNLLLKKIGWISYPIMITLLTTLGFCFLITANFLSNLPKKSYWRGFITSFVIIFILAIFSINIYASIHNYNLCK